MRFNFFKSWACPALTFLLLFLVFPGINAQAQTSQVRGVVQNNNNEPVPGVSVILMNAKTNVTQGTSTDATGAFTFTRVPEGGPYTFTFSNVGFETQNLTGSVQFICTVKK